MLRDFDVQGDYFMFKYDYIDNDGNIAIKTDTERHIVEQILTVMICQMEEWKKRLVHRENLRQEADNGIKNYYDKLLSGIKKLESEIQSFNIIDTVLPIIKKSIKEDLEKSEKSNRELQKMYQEVMNYE
jgi:hypothetical protein